MKDTKDEARTISKGKRLARILVPALVIITILGIWLIKNLGEADHNDDHPDFGLHVTEEFDIEQLIEYGLPIVLDFGADACIPCKNMAPVLEKLNKELRGKAIIRFVDVWKYPALVRGYPISTIPTQIFINTEGTAYIHEGELNEEQMMNFLVEMGLEQ